MNNVYISYEPLPNGVDGLISLDEYGDYNVCVSVYLSDKTERAEEYSRIIKDGYPNHYIDHITTAEKH